MMTYKIVKNVIPNEVQLESIKRIYNSRMQLMVADGQFPVLEYHPSDNGSIYTVLSVGDSLTTEALYPVTDRFIGKRGGITQGKMEY